MKNEVNKVLFIINRVSGTGYDPGVEGRIINACIQANLECRIAYTEGPGHATLLATEAVASNEYRMVVAVGGDGTVNETASGLLHSDVPLGILPKGSGNGLARHLGIPVGISPALKVLFKSHETLIDSFTVNGRLSLNVSGIGFDGHIANLFSKEKKRGLAGYTRLALHEFRQFKEFSARIHLPKQPIDSTAFIIAIANSSQYGNNARIAPRASVRDGLLNICLVKKIPIHRLDLLYHFFRGTVNRTSFFQTLETPQAEIQLNHPVAYHIDGEPCGTSDRFTIVIQPQSLKILIPDTGKSF